jgi:hypothetical protein
VGNIVETADSGQLKVKIDGYREEKTGGSRPSFPCHRHRYKARQYTVKTITNKRLRQGLPEP